MVAPSDGLTNDGDDSSGLRPKGLPVAEERPREIGPYRILYTMGHGPLGIVYLAEEKEPVRREVALKVIRLGLEAREVIARSAPEREALARLNHPGIAGVYDAGVTVSGRPYFVTEHCRGIPITEYCDLNRVGIRERLELFTQASNAVECAHRVGVIHSDLKPANVIVSRKEGRPLAKITDFVIARAMNQCLSDRAMSRRAGQPAGRAVYMSPEQTRGTEGIDNRTDVYSLGVLLYELLVGEPPRARWPLETRRSDEILRRLREKESVMRGARWSRPNHAWTTHPAAPPRALPLAFGDEHDLLRISLKAMDNDRDRRYVTASELVADIERALKSDAARAPAPSPLRTFVRENVAIVTAVAAIFLVLVVGLIVNHFMDRRPGSDTNDSSVVVEETPGASDVAGGRDAGPDARDGDRGEATRLDTSRGDVTPSPEVAPSREIIPEQIPPWEQRHLDFRRDLSLRTFEGHGDEVYCVVFSADGRLIASGSKDTTVRLWDAIVERRVATLEGHAQGVLCVDFSPDGNLVASGSSDRTVRIWEIGNVEGDERDPRLLATLGGHESDVDTVAFSPDGRRVASGSRDRTVRVWDIETRMLVSAQDFNRGPLCRLAFTPDGRDLVVAFATGKVLVLDAATLYPQAVFGVHQRAVWGLAVDASGTRVASSDIDGTIHLWSLTSGEILHTFEGGAGAAWSLDFRPDDRQLVSASDDGRIRIWNVEDGVLHTVLFGHEETVRAVQYSPDGERIASASDDGTVRIWDAETIAARVVLEGHENGIRAIDVSSDGRLIASGGNDGTARLWDATSGDLLATLRGHERGLWSVAFSPSDRLLTTAAMDDVILWSTETREQVGVLSGHGDEVIAQDYHPDGRRVATGARSGVVRLWHVATRSVVSTLEGHEDWVRCVRFRPDGERLASASHDGTVRLWDVETGALVSILSVGGGQVLCLAYSGDGAILATGSEDHTIRLWNGETGEPLRALRGHQHVIHWLEFSPEGGRLVSASHDRTLRLWDTGAYEQVASFESGVGDLSCFSFSPDGARIVAGTESHHLEIWETELASARALWHGAAKRRSLKEASERAGGPPVRRRGE